MINFTTIDVKTFLQEYWQKKPLVIRNALPDFNAVLTGDDLAGLALEEGIESRIVCEMPGHIPQWNLKNGPFVEKDFSQLPSTHWTLLVQGVDRWVPEVARLLSHFDCIPQWRVDDVMVSYAVQHGSVGPHYDNYDVFLYQAQGQRRWALTTKQCNVANSVPNSVLRIMAQFEVEEEYILEPGDMLYLPAHVGHHGVSLSPDCMTYSFGYRSYQGQELWDSFGEYLSEKMQVTGLYQDPDWSSLPATSEIPSAAYQQAKNLMLTLLENEQIMQQWFGCFATQIDQQAEQDMPEPLLDEEAGHCDAFIALIQQSCDLERDPTCRIAYVEQPFQLFINGCEWDSQGVTPELMKYVANNRYLERTILTPFLTSQANQLFLYELWRLQWLQWNN